MVFSPSAEAATSPAPAAPEFSAGWHERLPPHPRLVLTAGRLDKLKAAIEEPTMSAWLARLRERAVAQLAEPPTKHELTGRRMLAQSRRSLHRLLLWSLLYRLEGDKRFLDAASRELDAVVAFPDWNPSHYLDTAEMAAGVALAYDWLHADLGAERRSRIEAALRALVLDTFREHSAKLAGMSHNWNSVCHGGVVLAALAIADEFPDEAASALRAAIPALAKVRETYAPDGVFTEGPHYWDYGTSYLCLMADALQTAFGHTCGVDLVDGVLLSARAMEQLTSPTGFAFNFSDGSDRPRDLNFATAWLGARDGGGDSFLLRRFLERAQARTAASYEREMEHFDVLAFLFAALYPPGSGRDREVPLAWAGQGPVPVAAMRTSWSDPQAAYLAIKGGSAAFSHAHMDVGSFVYDWGGQRWFSDPDKQDYHSLEAAGFTNLFDLRQSSRRWEVFRNGAESHNILRFDQGTQNVKGVARRLEFSDGTPPTATVDLTPIYPEWVSALTRKVALFPDGRALIRDRWTLQPGKEKTEVAWQFVTAAAVEGEEDGVHLRRGGRSVIVRVLEPSGARVTVVPADSLTKPHDAPNPGLTRVQFVATGSDRFEVLIAPQGTQDKSLPGLAEIAQRLEPEAVR